MAPNPEVEDMITMTSSQSKVHSLKAAIFHTMAYKLSLEINKNKITPKTIIAFLKVLYNVGQIKTKKKSLLNSTLEFFFLLLPYSFRTSPLLLLLQDTLVMAPNPEVEDMITMTSSQSKVHSLKAAIFHTMAYKLSLEINKNKITPKTIIAFLKVLYNVGQIKTKKNHF